MKKIKTDNYVKVVYLALFLFTCFVSSAHARLSYFGEWQTKYASSNSDTASCQLCHQSGSGGDGWNEYGWEVRTAFLANGGMILNAFDTVEGIDSDGDPTGATNLEEINLSTQPGWTDGPGNSIYFKNGDIVDQSPPTLTTPLDPEITTNPDIEVSPDSLDFNNVVGITVTKMLTVANTGDSDLDISSIAFCPSSSSDYSLPGPGSLTIPTGSPPQMISVNYTPSNIGYDGGCLRISSNDPDQSLVDIPLTGQGLSETGELLDVDIDVFTVSSDAQVGSSPITISLSVTNYGPVAGLVKATVAGSLSATEIYSEEIIFDSGISGHNQVLNFPDYFPPSAGDIQWLAIVDDQDPDIDAANVMTSVTSSALADPIPDPIQQGSTSVAFETVASGLIAPNFATYAPGNAYQLYAVDQPGQVWRINLITRIRYLFMDVSDWLMPLGIFGPGSFDERGLLGLAFHPNYAINGLIYTYTSEPVSVPPDFATTLPPGIDADHQSVVTEWRVTGHTEASGYVDMTSVITSGRRVLLRIDEPQFNHNGGSVVFDPDGLLYIAVGDGGGADDRDGQPFIGGPMVGHSLNGNGQDTSNPLGAILRIDPQGDNSTNGQYGIPPDNPFVSDPSLGLGEIYAYGLRNPFRISFDTKDEDLYAGDVGQNDIEEINIIEKGGNYGWNRKEGNFFFNPNGIYSGFVHNDDPGDLINLIDPVLQYDHDEGISVTGGFVYRGQLFKQLKGKYVFGDWSNSFSIPSGRLFYQHQSSIHEFNLSDRPILGLFLHGFGQDHDGEMYVIGNETGTPFRNSDSVATGQVLKMVPGSKVKGGGKK